MPICLLLYCGSLLLSSQRSLPALDTRAGLEAIRSMNFFGKDEVSQTLNSLEDAQVIFCLCFQGLNREIP